jgi:uncharacterized membrane protein
MNKTTKAQLEYNSRKVGYGWAYIGGALLGGLYLHYAIIKEWDFFLVGIGVLVAGFFEPVFLVIHFIFVLAGVFHTKVLIDKQNEKIMKDCEDVFGED